MIRKIFDKLFYCPYRVARRDSRVETDNETILLKSTRFHFRSSGGKVSIGPHSMIGCNFIFESDQGKVTIGTGSFIGGGTNLISRNQITIGDDVYLGWNIYVYDHDSHSLNWRERVKDRERENQAYLEGRYLAYNKDWSVVRSAPITISSRAWIGFGAVILKGVTIGEGAVVAAGSIVTRDVPPYTIVAGNPAQPVRELSTQER